MNRHWMDYALKMASFSTCMRAQVGCVLVNGGSVVGEGCATALEGQPTCKDLGQCLMCPDTGGCIRTVHAEQNAISDALRYGNEYSTQGSTAFVTLSPCISCYKLLCSVGVVEIYAATMYRNQDHLLLNHHVKVIHLE